MVLDVYDPNVLQKEFGAQAEMPREIKRILDHSFAGEQKIGIEGAVAFKDDNVLTVVFPNIKNNQDLTVVYDKVWMEFPSTRAFRDAADRRGVQIDCNDVPALG